MYLVFVVGFLFFVYWVTFFISVVFFLFLC